MNKVESLTAIHQELNHVVREFPASEALESEDLSCVACRTSRAVGHTSHPEYRQLALCAECIAYYDQAITE